MPLNAPDAAVEPIEVPTPIYEPGHEPIAEYDNDRVFINNGNTEPALHDHAGSDAGDARRRRGPYGDDEEGDDAAGDDVGVCMPYPEDHADAKKAGVMQQAMNNISVLLVAVLLVQFVAFVLTVVATPLDVFRSRTPNSFIPNSAYRACYSMWGYKRCGPRPTTKQYFHRISGAGSAVRIALPSDGWVCDDYRTRMTAAASFAILSAVTCAVSLVGIILLLCRFMPRVLCIVLCVATAVMQLVCWACICSVYYISCDHAYSKPGLIVVNSQRALRVDYKFDVGFGLVLAAWCLQLITVVLLILL